MSRVAHIVVFMPMFQALMVKVDVCNESSDSQAVFGEALLGGNICMVATVITEAAVVTWYTFAGVEILLWKNKQVSPVAPDADRAGKAAIDDRNAAENYFAPVFA